MTGSLDSTWTPELWEGTPISWRGSDVPPSEVILREVGESPIASRLNVASLLVLRTGWPSNGFHGLSLPPDSFFAEYALSVDQGANWQRLWPALKVPFCVDGRRCERFADRLGYVRASQIQDQLRREFECPSWSWSASFWPELDGSLVNFAGSIPVPQTVPGALRVIAHLFYWYESSELELCIFEEVRPMQSLERHYAEEEQRELK